MNVLQVITYAFIGLAGAAAVGVLLSRNLLRATLWLVVCLLSVAALYVLAFAEFVAVTQILVYAGGILVVIIFGIMLTARLGQVPLRVQHKNIFSGFLLASLMLGALATVIREFPEELPNATPIDTHADTISAIGMDILTDYVLVFEVAGILLLMALIGAAVIASHKPRVS